MTKPTVNDESPKFWDRPVKRSESLKTHIIVAMAFAMIGVIFGYFGTIDLSNEARSDWIQAQQTAIQQSKDQSR